MLPDTWVFLSIGGALEIPIKRTIFAVIHCCRLPMDVIPTDKSRILGNASNLEHTFKVKYDLPTSTFARTLVRQYAVGFCAASAGKKSPYLL